MNATFEVTLNESNKWIIEIEYRDSRTQAVERTITVPAYSYTDGKTQAALLAAQYVKDSIESAKKVSKPRRPTRRHNPNTRTGKLVNGVMVWDS